MKGKLYIVLVLLALVLVSCGQEEPSQIQSLNVSICLPAEETLVTNNSPMRRAIGDPGKAERFLPPNFVYFIIMKQLADNTWTVWDTVGRELHNLEWYKRRYSGPLQTSGDSIYMHMEPIRLVLKNQKFNGRVYAIASAVPLRFNRQLSTIANMEQLLDVAFDASSETVQQNLQHIYSTPYNYIVDGKYYGSFSSIDQRVPVVNLMMYHVAAKVDITWNVVDSMRIRSNPAEAVRLTDMLARNLYSGNAYCFKPMRNEMASVASTGSTIQMVQPDDEGLWWEGRSYFYTIPYTVTGASTRFPLQMQLRTNGGSANYRPTINLSIDTTATFVPWLRANFNLTKPLEEKTETINS